MIPETEGNVIKIRDKRAASPSRFVVRPVIFLDIDGVLNRESKKTTKSKDHVVDLELLARLRALISSTCAYVVFASTWRHDPGGIERAQELGIPFEDVLPDLRPGARGDEVKAWLASHPDVRYFAIIDDDDDGYDDLPLFQPNPYQGLTGEVATAVEEYFSGQRENDYRRSLSVRLYQYLKTLVEGHRG